MAPRSARQLRASVSPALDRVVQRCLAVSPADRFATAKDFMDALARARTRETDVSSIEPTRASTATRETTGALPTPGITRWRPKLTIAVIAVQA